MSSLVAQTGDVPEGVQRLSRAWWLLLVVGLLSIAAGIIVLSQPAISLVTLAVVTGIFLLVDGIFEIVSSFSKRTEHRGLVALLGILSLIAGALLVRHPFHGVVAIALLLALWLLTVGVVHLVEAFAYAEHRGWRIFTAVIEILAGTALLANPEIRLSALAIVIGIVFIVRGTGLSVGSFAFRQLKHGTATA